MMYENGRLTRRNYECHVQFLYANKVVGTDTPSVTGHLEDSLGYRGTDDCPTPERIHATEVQRPVCPRSLGLHTTL